MDGKGLHDGGERQAKVRGRLLELRDGQRWVHHAADLATTEVITTELDGPVTPGARIDRLARLGRHVDLGGFGGPSYRLTARAPYQASPEGYLVAWNPTVHLPFDDTIVWEVPRDFEHAPLRGVDCFFADSPDEPALVTISFSAKAWSGRAGAVHVVAYRNAVTVDVPVHDWFAAHTVDLAVPPPGPRSLDVSVTIGAGVELFTFRSLTFRAGFLVGGVLTE